MELRKPKPTYRERQTKRKDLTGLKFGKLTAIKLYDKIATFSKGTTHPLWICECECGKTKVVDAYHLRDGHTKSCGCLINSKNSSFNLMWGRYRGSARARNMAFDLTKEEFRAITQSDCYYCGAKPGRFQTVVIHKKTKEKAPPYVCNGVDRRDNKIGYTKENSVPCCTECNMSKHTRTEQQFLDLVFRIYRYIRTKPTVAIPGGVGHS